jgi:agmatine deiminase
MILDKEANFVYFSERLKLDSRFTSTCKCITEILDECQVNYDFLKCTKDIWARDYMPIQVSKDKFIEYRYDPDYLQSKRYSRDKTDPGIVCDEMGFKTTKTDLIIDGGNVIRSSDCVIMTDKVLNENKGNYTQTKLIEKLKQLFEVDKILLIPWDKENDCFGHADGMIRFIDDNTVLLQGYFDSYGELFKNKLFEQLKQNGLQLKYLRYNAELEDEENNWAYMNYLQTKDIILLPKLGIEEDEQAYSQICGYFPEYDKMGRIRQVDIREILKYGGALNCISWTIKI